MMSAKNSKIPKTMRVLRLHEAGAQGLRLEEQNVPQPGIGEVLIHVMAAHVSAADLQFIEGKYSIDKPLPCVPGFEGSGVVVTTGGGFSAWRLQGKRVAFSALGVRNGVWAEYVMLPAQHCIALDEKTTYDQGAASFVGPLSALAMMDVAKDEKHRAIVHTDAASQVGLMLLKLCREEELPLICVVHNDEEEAVVRNEGARYIVNSQSPAFQEDLTRLALDAQASLAFDAKCGDITGLVLACLPPGSTLYLYGGITQELCGHINPAEIMMHEKQLKGLWLPQWLRQKSVWALRTLTRRAQALTSNLHIEYRIGCGLAEGLQLLQSGGVDLRRGHVLLLPDKAEDAGVGLAQDSEIFIRERYIVAGAGGPSPRVVQAEVEVREKGEDGEEVVTRTKAREMPPGKLQVGGGGQPAAESGGEQPSKLQGDALLARRQEEEEGV